MADQEKFAEYQARRIEWKQGDVERGAERLVSDIERLAGYLRDGLNEAGEGGLNAEYLADRAYGQLESLLRTAHQLRYEATDLRVRRELAADYAKAQEEV